MPRPPKPSLYQRGNVWQYRFTVKGKRHRGSTSCRDRPGAESFLAAKWSEAHKGQRLPANGPTARLELADLAGLWLAEVEAQASEHGPQFYARHKLDTRYILRHFRLASEVNNDAWQAAMRELRAGLSWRSLQHATVTLRHLMRFAHRQQAIPAVPELKPPKNKLVASGAAPRRALTEGERDRVLKAMRLNGDHRAARIWQAMAYSGLRRSEMAALTLRWLDLAADVVRIPAAVAKSREEETIPLHPLVRQAVRAEGVKDRDVPVFGRFDLRKAWARALSRAKVDKVGLTPHHTARHTFGTVLAQLAKGDVTAVQAGGRWRSLAMVQRYVHSSAERARSAMKRM